MQHVMQKNLHNENINDVNHTSIVFEFIDQTAKCNVLMVHFAYMDESQKYIKLCEVYFYVRKCKSVLPL